MSYVIPELDSSTVQFVVDELSSKQCSVVPVSDGTRLVFRIECDEFADVRDDQDWIGRIAECSDGGWYRHQSRPEGFDGAARKVRAHTGDVWWWQPPSDAVSDDALVQSLRRELVDILTYGYSLLSVTLQESCSHHAWHDVSGTSIGGLGPNTDWAMMVPEVMSWLHDSEDVAA